MLDLAGMPARDSSSLRRVGGFAGEFIFISAVLFGSLGVAVIVLGGFNPFEGGMGLVFFAAVILIAAVHHRWYARHREEIESSPVQKARRERRGY